MSGENVSYFAKYLNLSIEAVELLPNHLRQQAKSRAADCKTPDEAKQALQEILPYMGMYKRDAEFSISCAMLLEKQRLKEGMLEAWHGVQEHFPLEPIPIRLVCRWYRRLARKEEGLQFLRRLLPQRIVDVAQAELAILGYVELEEQGEMDLMMREIQNKFPNERRVRMRYMRSLAAQHRYRLAQEVSLDTKQPRSMGQAARTLLQTVERRAAIMDIFQMVHGHEAIGKLVRHYAKKRQSYQNRTSLGTIVFFTGQLGPGGAERQMTRIAAAFQNAYISQKGISGIALLERPQVCVRQAAAFSGKDFFLPVLSEAGVKTQILSDFHDPQEEDLSKYLDTEIQELAGFLSKDVRNSTQLLVEYFRKEQVDTVYLWQDGGVLAGALAALIAEVPRIVTSFRGQPPNLRPELFRAEMPYLYQELANVNGVLFSANSRSTAQAYETWLGLKPESLRVIQNYVPPVLPEGGAQEEKLWRDIQHRSPERQNTVLGVFRYDANKRPDYWVELANDYSKKHGDTRFIIVGDGYLFAKCQKIITDHQAEDRIFLVGNSQKVGFWMHKADLLLHLARMEGLPNVLIEASLAGCPSLATPAGGTAEIIQHGKSGHILSQAKDPTKEEILASLTELLADQKKLQRLGKQAERIASTKFGLQEILGQTVSLFSDTNA